MSRHSINIVQSMNWCGSKVKKCERYPPSIWSRNKSGRKLCHTVAAGFNLKQGWPQEHKDQTKWCGRLPKSESATRGVWARNRFALLHVPSSKSPTLYRTQAAITTKPLWSITDEKGVGVDQTAQPSRGAFAFLANRVCRCHQQTPLHMWWPGWKQALRVPPGSFLDDGGVTFRSFKCFQGRFIHNLSLVYWKSSKISVVVDL